MMLEKHSANSSMASPVAELDRLVLTRNGCAV
jgi:hypothetical protein